MDTSTGEIYYGKDAIEAALKTGRIKSANDLVVLPEEIADELHGMNRKERRLWWKQNRKKLNLPRWSERQALAPHQDRYPRPHH